MSPDATPGPAARSRSAACWRLDPSASSAEFRVPHFWGLIAVRGRFTGLDGVVEFADGRVEEMALTIDAASLRTGNRRRDHHLRSGDFFDTDEHPFVRFRSRRVSAVAEDRLRIEGELEAGGGRVSLALEPTLRQTGDALEVDVTTTVDQRQLGMTWSPLGITRSPVTVAVHATLRRVP